MSERTFGEKVRSFVESNEDMTLGQLVARSVQDEYGVGGYNDEGEPEPYAIDPYEVEDEVVESFIDERMVVEERECTCTEDEACDVCGGQSDESSDTEDAERGEEEDDDDEETFQARFERAVENGNVENITVGELEDGLDEDIPERLIATAADQDTRKTANSLYDELL